MYDDLISSLRICKRINSENDNCIAFHDGCCEAEPVCMYELMDKAADAIEKLSVVVRAQKAVLDKFPRWNPVTEALPKAERKSFWVCTDTGYQCECRWTNNRFGIRELDDWGWCLFDIPPYQKVVAWMQLPCPYDPPEEGET